MSRRRRFGLLTALLALLAEALVLSQRGYGLGGNVVVRCRDGHLYTTIWIPGVSLKSLRLGWWRLQRCPVGGHWSLVTPVDETELSGRQQRLAHQAHDIQIP